MATSPATAYEVACACGHPLRGSYAFTFMGGGVGLRHTILGVSLHPMKPIKQSNILRVQLNRLGHLHIFDNFMRHHLSFLFSFPLLLVVCLFHLR